jgi:hypothetical protein
MRLLFLLLLCFSFFTFSAFAQMSIAYDTRQEPVAYAVDKLRQVLVEVRILEQGEVKEVENFGQKNHKLR